MGERAEEKDRLYSDQDGDGDEKGTAERKHKSPTSTHKEDSEKEGLLSGTEAPRKIDMKLDIVSTAVLAKQQQHQQGRQAFQSPMPLSPLKVAVFIKKDRKLDEVGSYMLDLEKGRTTTAGEIKDKMLELLSIPKSSAHLFAMWLISPHLELQMKFHHKPFYLRKQWQDLLLKLTNCQNYEAHLDEPVMVFQRNCFITIEEEEKDTEHNVLKRLFEEACFNVLKARYPIPVSDAEMLGGILLRCYEGEFDQNKHQPGFFKKRLSEFLPYYAIGSNKISQYINSSGTEQRLLQQYQSMSEKLNDKAACYEEYLKYCHTLDFYGCVFFKGQVYQEGVDYKIWKSEQMSITVGINRHGVTLFKADNEAMLTHLPHHAFSFAYKNDDPDPDDDDDTPVERFIIEFDESGGPRQIQIHTKQACMMDAMVQSCMNFIVSEKTDQDTIDRPAVHGISYIPTARIPAEA